MERPTGGSSGQSAHDFTPPIAHTRGRHSHRLGWGREGRSEVPRHGSGTDAYRGALGRRRELHRQQKGADRRARASSPSPATKGRMAAQIPLSGGEEAGERFRQGRRRLTKRKTKTRLGKPLPPHPTPHPRSVDSRGPQRGKRAVAVQHLGFVPPSTPVAGGTSRQAVVAGPSFTPAPPPARHLPPRPPRRTPSSPTHPSSTLNPLLPSPRPTADIPQTTSPITPPRPPSTSPPPFLRYSRQARPARPAQTHAPV